MMTGRDLSRAEEGRLLIQKISETLPATINAKEAILSMKEGGSRHWKQMEWIGFYPEFWFDKNLAISLGTTPGPSFGNMAFDLQRKYVWDMKAHADSKSSWSPLNDLEAIRGCIDDRGGVGFLVISGRCDYDEDGSFKSWHEVLKGGPSSYSRRVAERGAKSRKRKISFSPDHLIAFRFESHLELERAEKEGWIRGFQAGMRNSNDNKRRPKIMADLDNIGGWALIADVKRPSP